MRQPIYSVAESRGVSRSWNPWSNMGTVPWKNTERIGRDGVEEERVGTGLCSEVTISATVVVLRAAARTGREAALLFTMPIDGLY